MKRIGLSLLFYKNRKSKEKSCTKTNIMSDTKYANARQIEIDYDKLAEAIVRASQRVKEEEKEIQFKREKEEKAEWNKLFHYAECSEEKGWFVKSLYAVRNDFMMILSALFFEKKNAQKPIVSFNLLRMLLQGIFFVCLCQNNENCQV